MTKAKEGAVERPVEDDELPKIRKYHDGVSHRSCVVCGLLARVERDRGLLEAALRGQP